MCERAHRCIRIYMQIQDFKAGPRKTHSLGAQYLPAPRDDIHPSTGTSTSTCTRLRLVRLGAQHRRMVTGLGKQK